MVANSHGVQVGDHNVQHNEFRIRMTDVTIRAAWRIGLRATLERKAAISRLRESR